jgi:hypothetical protein
MMQKRRRECLPESERGADEVLEGGLDELELGVLLEASLP